MSAAAFSRQTTMPWALAILLNLTLHAIPALAASGNACLVLVCPSLYLLSLADAPLAWIVELLIPVLAAQLREHLGILRMVADLRRFAAGLQTQRDLWSRPPACVHEEAAEADDLRAVLDSLRLDGAPKGVLHER